MEAALAESEVEVKESAAGTKEQRSTWARLMNKVYGIDPLKYPKFRSDMEIKKKKKR